MLLLTHSVFEYIAPIIIEEIFSYLQAKEVFLKLVDSLYIILNQEISLHSKNILTLSAYEKDQHFLTSLEI